MQKSKTIVLITLLAFTGVTFDIGYSEPQPDVHISNSLKKLIENGTKGERIVIVLLKDSPEIQKLQSKRKEYNLSYKERSKIAKNTRHITNIKKELSTYGKFFNNGEYISADENGQFKESYFLYLNAILMKVPIEKLNHFMTLPFVKEIWDGEIEIRPIGTRMEKGDFENKQVSASAVYDWGNLIANNWGYSNVEADKLHQEGYKGSGLKIAVIDTGFDEQHPLYNPLWTYSYDESKVNVWSAMYYYTDFDGLDDQDGHGTADAGVVWQIAPEAYYIICEAPTFLYQISSCFDWANQEGAHVITTSLGTSGASPSDGTSSLAKDASAAADGDTTVTAAAGNSGDGDKYPVDPSTGKFVLSVSSIKSDNNIYPSSSPLYSYPNYWGEKKPTLAAPGKSIYTLDTVESGYTSYWSGSSFAAPHVAGVATILRMINNNPVTVEEALKNTAIDVSGTNLDGYGRISAWNAFSQLACEGVTCNDYCGSGNVKYYSGSCVAGSCDYSSYDGDNDDEWVCASGNVKQYKDYYCSGGSCTYSVKSPVDCDDYDGWYNYDDAGSGCSNMNDPVAENRNYYCLEGSCLYSVSSRKNCNDQDGWYGGGDAGCGTFNDPASQRRDYYVTPSGTCTYTTTNCGTKDCDSSDGWYGGGNTAGCGDDPTSYRRDYYVVSNTDTCNYCNADSKDCDSSDVCTGDVCDGGIVKDYLDYYVVSNSDTCKYDRGSTIEDCTTKTSYDSDGSSTAYTTGGYVYDYTRCSGGSCSLYNTYNDACGSGNVLTEYYASGSSYGSGTKDCDDYDTSNCWYTCDTGTGDIDQVCDDWRCYDITNDYCYNTGSDWVKQDPASDCSDICSGETSPSYFSFDLVTDYELCSAGQTSCPSTVQSDSCGAENVLTEWYCSGNDATYATQDCDDYDGWTCNGSVRENRIYSCSSGACTSSIISSEDCATKNAENSGDTGNVPTVYGSCTDYSTCTPSACSSTTYDDSCVTSTALVEYYASGTSCSSQTYYCSDVEIAATDTDGGDSPAVAGTCTTGKAAECSSNTFYNWSGSGGGTDSCLGTCGTGADSCYYVEYYPIDSGDSCGSADSCTSKVYYADDNQYACTNCGQYWNIGGEINGTACCGDDAGENRDTRACSSGVCASDANDDACCDTTTDCVYNSVCYADGYVGNPSGDGSSEKCSAGTWTDAQPPTLETPEIYSSNAYGDYYSGSPIDIRANASDTGGSGLNTATCEYSIDGTNWYPASWDGTYCYKTGVSVSGTINVEFRANDAIGNQGTSATRTFYEDSTPPTISIISPNESSFIYGSPGNYVEISYTYTEANPYSVTINIYNTTTVIGKKTITTGLAGGTVSRSDSVQLNESTADGVYNVNISISDKLNAPAVDTEANAIKIDSIAPNLVHITSPDNNSMFRGTIEINAEASDALSGMEKVEFLANGISLGIDTTPSSPYSYTWDTTSTVDGDYLLTARAYDKAGNTNTSTPVYVTVDNTPPSITGLVTDPSIAGVNENVSITTNADDVNDIDTVLAEIKYPNGSKSDVGLELQNTVNSQNDGSQSNWWDSSWGYRKQLYVITGSNTPYGNYSGYTVQFTTDTSDSNKFQTDGDDLRIVYWNSTEYVELDREILYPGTSSTTVRFKLQANISASSNDNDYYMYYGNNGASAGPSNKSNVYLWYDDASVDRKSQYTQGRVDLTAHRGAWADSIAWNSAGYYTFDTGDNFADSLRPTDLAERDIYVEYEEYQTGAYETDMTSGPLVRWVGTGSGGTEDSSHWYYYEMADSTFQTRSYASHDDITADDRDGGNEVVTFGQLGDFPANTWTRLGIAAWGADGTNLKAYYNNESGGWGGYRFSGTHAAVSDNSDPGQFGLWLQQDTGRIRNILARRYTKPEPNISINPEEAITVGANTFKFNFTDTSQYGKYNVTIIANDTFGNVNNTEKAVFVVAHIFSKPSFNTTKDKPITINASDMDTTLDIVTLANVTGSIDIIESSVNLPGTSALSVSTLGKYIQINASDDLKNNLAWAIIKVSYTDDEISESGLEESSLSFYWWNESSSQWVELTKGSPSWVNDAGVDTTNNFVWANVSHFSHFTIGEGKDTDGDGIPDSIDECPTQPENFNGYQDDDGCPDERPNGPNGPNGPVTPPKIYMLANSIDLNLSANFTDYMVSKRVKVEYLNASNFTTYKKMPNIVILGGPDASEGVGEIVREVLNETEQAEVRATGSEKFYIKESIWTSWQRVFIIAGSDRWATKEACADDMDTVKAKLK